MKVSKGNYLSQVQQIGRQICFSAMEIDECLDRLDDMQARGILNSAGTFTDEELSIIGQALEILMTKGKAIQPW